MLMRKVFQHSVGMSMKTSTSIRDIGHPNSDARAPHYGLFCPRTNMAEWDTSIRNHWKSLFLLALPTNRNHGHVTCWIFFFISGDLSSCVKTVIHYNIRMQVGKNKTKWVLKRQKKNYIYLSNRIWKCSTYLSDVYLADISGREWISNLWSLLIYCKYFKSVKLFSSYIPACKGAEVKVQSQPWYSGSRRAHWGLRALLNGAGA